MTKTWPTFVTKDIDPEDENEMEHRWDIYNREMQAIIASGVAHQDEDGWWIETATGELIGPDPEIERPWTDAELAKARPLREVLPHFQTTVAEKESVSLKLDVDVVARLKATGPGWQSTVNTALRDYLDSTTAQTRTPSQRN